VEPPHAIACEPRHPRARAVALANLFAVANFKELEDRIAALPAEDARGVAFEVFAEAWLATQRLSQARNVWPADSVPSEVQSKLRLPLKDMGVDGVFDTALDEYVCYQAKFRSGRPSLTWTEIATFFGLADFAAQRLLFTNCDDVSEIAEQRRDVVFIRGSDLDRLTAEDFDAMRAWLAGAAVIIAKKSPKPHQYKAIEKILHAFGTKARVTALMACGTGKTLVALWTAERLQSRSVLVLVPSLALVRQVLHEWLHETNWPKMEYLCVCSDESVDRGNDELIVRPSDVDFKVTTENSAVREFLLRELAGVRVVFSTYQSSPVVGAAAEGLPPFDFAVFDEAHKTAGREGAKFGYALSDERLRINRRLFMTATPRHYDVEIRDKAGDAKLVYSMDVPEVYGPVAHRISFSEAAKLGIISDYKVVISIVTSEMVTNELLRRGTVLVSGEEIKASQVANQIALRRAVEEYGVRKIFTFHSRIAAAESFTSGRPEGIRQHLSAFSCFFVKGVMPAVHRDKLLREFSTSDRGIMSNARCLTEGVDLPAVDMVAFFSPKRSLVDIVQATGRAMRRAPGKAFGYVLVPLYVEQTQGETVDQAVIRSKFDEVWRVLQSLKEHDDLLAQIISDMRIERGRTGGYDDARFRERVEVLGPALSLENLRRSITATCIDALGETWFERYGELLAYKEKFGHCDVPKRSMGKDKKLANWIVQQRVSKNDGTLSGEKIDLLDRLGFKWHPYGHRWRTNYLALIDFKQRFGHCRVPQEWKENRKLATWVCSQRVRRKAGELQSDRIEALDKLGFDWAIDVATWEDRFKELCAYKDRFHNTRVPARWSENRQLGAWVVDQRHDRRRGKIRPEHEQRLNEIGFEWDLTEKDPAGWDKMFAELQRYKEAHGTCRVPLDNEHRNLAHWCQAQRRRLRSGRLLDRRKQKLEQISFEWSPPSSADKWIEMFRRLSEHRQRTSSCAVKEGDESARSLRSWCTRQRKLFRLGLLSEAQVSNLNSLGFEWIPRRRVHSPSIHGEELDSEAAWSQKFNELLEFFKIHGHYDVPQRWKPNPNLAAWVSVQRRAHRNGSLPDEFTHRLNALGFRWNPLTDRWSEMYEALLRFRSRFNHTNVPQEWKKNPKLAHWVAVQRRQKKLGRLSENRIAKLNSVGFEWVRGRGGVGKSGIRTETWEAMFAQLEKFYRENGHSCVPQQYRENPKLGWWVTTQRKNRRKNKLTSEHITRLDTLQFPWSPMKIGRPRQPREKSATVPKADRWEEMLDALKAFKEERGHCRVPRDFKGNTRLADWVSRLRTSRNKGMLPLEQEKNLTEIGFDWNPVTNRWDYMFDQLVEFRKEHGHTNVPQRSDKYAELAHWVRNQRAAKRYNRPIIAERGRCLDAIGFIWRLNDPNSWESMFDTLVEFKKVYGHCNVPQHWKENKCLGRWVNTQRTAYKRGKISAEKQKLLEEVGFVWRLAPTNKRLIPVSS
jgi:superfamily II DNA or RNA helicase